MKFRRKTFWFLLFGWSFWPATAWSQNCSFGVSEMSFGQVGTLSGAQTNSTATLTVNCTGLPSSRILICPNLGTGSGGATAAARQMLSGTNSLNYQLYSDTARSVVWGSYSWPYPARAPALALTLNALGGGSGSATIYGAVLGNQTTVRPVGYSSAFSGSHVEVRYRYSTGTNCNSGVGTIARPSFNVTATVPANCLIATQNVDFGSVGVLSTNVDATGVVAVTCTPGNAYTVALNGGTTSSPPIDRKMSKGAERVSYGLYKDANRSQPWGDTAVQSGTGSGIAQNFTVYGRVPPQATPSPGVYTDTVIVTVTY